jgi:hypothetical protein
LLPETTRTLKHIGSLALNLPEFHVFLFSFLLNFPWEILQAPFYAGMTTAPHWPASLVCVRAALGDAALTTIAFWVVALVSGRYWITSPLRGQGIAFVAATIAAYVAMEKAALATGRWAYNGAMVIVPLVDVGLNPVAQAAILALLTIWIVRRQMSQSSGG